MVCISVGLEKASKKPQMVEVNLWALGQERQASTDGTNRRIHGTRDPESHGWRSQRGSIYQNIQQ